MNVSATNLALDAPDVVSVAPSRSRTFAVQIRYPRSPWVTLARVADHRAAVRRAAAAYREAVSPEGALPTQVRLVELPTPIRRRRSGSE